MTLDYVIGYIYRSFPNFSNMGKGKIKGNIKIKTMKQSGKSLEDFCQKYSDNFQNFLKSSKIQKEVEEHVSKKVNLLI